jgi:hypothetical protein
MIDNDQDEDHSRQGQQYGGGDLAGGVARLVARAEQRAGVRLEQEDLGRRWVIRAAPMYSNFLSPAINASLVVGSNHCESFA